MIKAIHEEAGDKVEVVLVDIDEKMVIAWKKALSTRGD